MVGLVGLQDGAARTVPSTRPAHGLREQLVRSLRGALVGGPPERLTEGRLELPEGPGLGLEIDEDVVTRYRVAR